MRTLRRYDRRPGARWIYGPGRCESLGVNSSAVIFGQDLIPESVGGTIRVGDAVEVLKR